MNIDSGIFSIELQSLERSWGLKNLENELSQMNDGLILIEK